MLSNFFENQHTTQLKGQVTFLKTLSVGSVPGTDHSQIYAFLINNHFQAEKCIYMPVPAQPFFASVDPSTLEQLQRGWFFGSSTKKKNRIHSSVFWQVSHSPKLCIYHSSCPLFQISHVYNGIEIPFFCQRRRRLRWHSIYFMFIWLQTQKGSQNSKWSLQQDCRTLVLCT